MKRLMFSCFFALEVMKEAKTKAIFDAVTAHVEMLFNSMKLPAKRVIFFKANPKVFYKLFT